MIGDLFFIFVTAPLTLILLAYLMGYIWLGMGILANALDQTPDLLTLQQFGFKFKFRK